MVSSADGRSVHGWACVGENRPERERAPVRRRGPDRPAGASRSHTRAWRCRRGGRQFPTAVDARLARRRCGRARIPGAEAVKKFRERIGDPHPPTAAASTQRMGMLTRRLPRPLLAGVGIPPETPGEVCAARLYGEGHDRVRCDHPLAVWRGTGRERRCDAPVMAGGVVGHVVAVAEAALDGDQVVDLGLRGVLVGAAATPWARPTSR